MQWQGLQFQSAVQHLTSFLQQFQSHMSKSHLCFLEWASGPHTMVMVAFKAQLSLSPSNHLWYICICFTVGCYPTPAHFHPMAIFMYGILLWNIHPWQSRADSRHRWCTEYTSAQERYWVAVYFQPTRATVILVPVSSTSFLFFQTKIPSQIQILYTQRITNLARYCWSNPI